MSSRKYEKGIQIRSLQEFERCAPGMFIISNGWHEKVYTYAWVISWPVKLLLTYINAGSLWQAVRICEFAKMSSGVNRRCTACGAYLKDEEYENHTIRYCYYCGAKVKESKEQRMKLMEEKENGRETNRVP